MHEKSEFSIEGPLTQQTVMAWLGEIRSAWENQVGDCVIDFSKVTQVDSAGLAFLVALLRLAKKHAITVSFKALPPQLMALAKVSGVEEWLKQDA